MNVLEEYRLAARSWLQSVSHRYGSRARRGLLVNEDLELARSYQKAKFDAGYAGIDLPVDFGGQGQTRIEKLAFDTEELAFNMPTGYFRVTLGMPIPILIQFGTDKEWVRQRVEAALAGAEIWCQLFSEPAAGSDLAAVRLRAQPEGDKWRLNGQKLWTSWAQYSDYGILLARNDPNVPKHQGLTYFWVDMRTPGVTVRPIRLAGGVSEVNEVFFDDVAIDDRQRLSAVGKGFGLALTTLMIERHVAIGGDGFGPKLESFIEVARNCEINGRPAVSDARVRSAIARHFALRTGLEAISTRAMLMMEAGMEPGPEGSINKLVSIRNRQMLSELAVDLQGNLGIAFDKRALESEDWTASWINAPKDRIAGGSDEVLLNTIAERILGLPQDYRPDKGIAFSEIPV